MTSAACPRESTGLIGMARWVRATLLGAGQRAGGRVPAHRRLAVGRHPVVRLVADPGRLQRRRQLVRARVADHVQVPRRLAHGAREIDQLAEPLRLIERRRGRRRPPSRPGAAAARAGSPPAARPAAVVAHQLERLLVTRAVEAQHPARSAIASSRVVTAPPSPGAPRFLDGKNENVAAVPSAPGRPPSLPEPAACAASSSTGTPSASISATGATLPNRCTAITALCAASAPRARCRRSRRTSPDRRRRTPAARSAGSPPPTRRT